jgi:predicted ATPase/DNA-binding CsgD family transcriptional regulator
MEKRRLLTERELEIARLMAEGLSNQEIADRLVLTHGTVKWYCSQIYSKLGVTTRAQAMTHIHNIDLEPKTCPSQPGSDLHIPAQLTSFVGRAAEIADIRRLLRTNRLLTLTGAGGTGKTRLALAVMAQCMDDFADGAFFIDLAPLSDAMLVTKAIASALGVIENPADPLLDTLKRALAGREQLLLMDNFEHVIAAAPVIPALLASAPRLKVLATSREALRVSGEQKYPVSPLSLPSIEGNAIRGIAESDAVDLFVQRVQLVLPGFRMNDDNAMAAAQICIRLDGLPLAIELAAAHCKVLSPPAMLARLDKPLTILTGGARDAPLRQQTLRATMEWSYDLLESGEKQLFARLAVFRGGCSLEAVEVVCGEDLSIDPTAGLTSLVEKNLVQPKESPEGEPRFVLLETLREYAAERLAASDEADTLSRRHATYFTELAESSEPERYQAQKHHWYQPLESERDNLRASLEWSVSRGDVTLAVRLAGALSRFWWSGYHVEGGYWTQQLLPRLDEVPKQYHAKLLVSAAIVIQLHDFVAARRLYTRALGITRELGDKPLEAWILTYIGYTLLNTPDEAFTAVEESLALFRKLDHKPGIAEALTVIGEIARLSGDKERAKQAYEESLVVAQQVGSKSTVFVSLCNLALVAHAEGDHLRARDLLYQGLRLTRERHNRPYSIASGLAYLAGPLSALGQSVRAARLLGAAEAALERLGAFYQQQEKPWIDRTIANVRAQLGETTFAAAWAEGRALTLEQAVTEALS